MRQAIHSSDITLLGLMEIPRFTRYFKRYTLTEINLVMQLLQDDDDEKCLRFMNLVHQSQMHSKTMYFSHQDKDGKLINDWEGHVKEIKYAYKLDDIAIITITLK